ncbi:MAG: YceI family protein [Proteobacteria bacterium]|nr:YceI family protein [Pseudomonadota bacterium]
MISRNLLLTALFLSLVACAADPGEGKAAAEVSEPAPAAEEPAAAEPAPAGDGLKRAVDLAQSKVHAVGAKVTRQHDIDFSISAADIAANADGTLTGLNVTVDMSSLKADVEKLTGHLKSDDFFNVAEHPTATFASKSVTPGSETEGATHTVSGELTLVGTTNIVTFPATVSTDEEGTIKARAEFVIDRQQWGITYPGKPDDLIKDNVALTIDIVAPPEG